MTRLRASTVLAAQVRTGRGELATGGEPQPACNRSKGTAIRLLCARKRCSQEYENAECAGKPVNRTSLAFSCCNHHFNRSMIARWHFPASLCEVWDAKFNPSRNALWAPSLALCGEVMSDVAVRIVNRQGQHPQLA